MRDDSIQNKKAWEYDAYNFWVRTAGTPVERASRDKENPKRMQREAKKQMLEIGIGTKSQQALKLQQEQNKQERKEKRRKRKEAEEQRMFELKQREKLEENAKK